MIMRRRTHWLLFLTRSLLCSPADRSLREHPFEFSEAANLKYGAFYGQLFAIRTPGDDPASLSFLWGKESGQWKIIWYQMITP